MPCYNTAVLVSNSSCNLSTQLSAPSTGIPVALSTAVLLYYYELKLMQCRSRGAGPRTEGRVGVLLVLLDSDTHNIPTACAYYLDRRSRFDGIERLNLLVIYLYVCSVTSPLSRHHRLFTCVVSC